MIVPSLSRRCRLVARAACAVGGLALVVAATPSVALASQAAPEIDAGAASSALAVLSGGVLLLTDRLLRRKA
jgi:hypothetical protein